MFTTGAIVVQDSRRRAEKPVAKKFITAVAGESHHRDALALICVEEPADGARLFCTASLVCEDENPFDHQAVKVMIRRQHVGYLSREDAPSYREKFGTAPTECQALITAGWNRGPEDCGDYCVRLAIDLD